ncbi:hypothetical protein TNCV_3366891 [Trichonephila clavipes]|nr:hypothetical protein TNCV_3366891 [Trichonephila clavipes]
MADVDILHHENQPTCAWVEPAILGVEDQRLNNHAPSWHLLKKDAILVNGQHLIEYGCATVVKVMINRLPLVVAYELPTKCEEPTCLACTSYLRGADEV